MKKEKVATVTVTFNRKDLLLRNIRKIMEQNYKVDSIIIIDNNSTDNTKEAVLKEFPNSNIEYVYLSENTGGAGGFYNGCKYAYEHGYDWVILMDDDGMPKNPETIGNLIGKVKELKLYSKDKVMFNALVLNDDENLTFSLFERNETLKMIQDKAKNGMVLDRINPFNGTLISKGLMREIGYPNKELFLTYDEQDYFVRAKKANAEIATVVNSLYHHPINACGKNVKILWKKIRIFSQAAPWKEYYRTRNHVYIYRDNKKYIRKLLIKKIIAVLANKCNKIKCFKMIVKGYRDGKRGKLGKTVLPS